MLNRERHISELYTMKHRSDNSNYKSYDIENNLLKRSMSGHIFENNNMNSFLLRLQKLVYLLVDQMYIMKNFKNYMVEKYHDDHVD